jgi:hypothetical protein
MPFYSENQIRRRHAEFLGLKKYADKLNFFDRLFGIIPFSFPDFDPQLSFFFKKEKMEELHDIFKKERNNPGLTEKKFSYGRDFIFNIRPANSNSAVYSNYILSCFLSRAPIFSGWIHQKKTTDKPIEIFLDDANGIVNQIEYNLQYERDKSFTLQCMAVFYKGFQDAFSNRVYGSGKKRKFTELFLYAQGIIYSNYISALKIAYDQSRNPVDLHKPVSMDISGKISLLNELGIIDFLVSKYGGLDSLSFENKVAEMLCLIMGEQIDQKGKVTQMLSSLNRQVQYGRSKSNAYEIHQKIIRMAMRK